MKPANLLHGVAVICGEGRVVEVSKRLRAANVDIRRVRFVTQADQLQGYVGDIFDAGDRLGDGASLDVCRVALTRLGRAPGTEARFLTLEELRARTQALASAKPAKPTTKRDEPRILADLIRASDRIEQDASGEVVWTPERSREMAELIEQARAALHGYVVAQGKADLAALKKHDWWTGIVCVVAFIGGALSHASGTHPAIGALALIAVLVPLYVLTHWRQIERATRPR
jgi:hypothetical protein